MKINDKKLIFKLPSNKLSLEITEDNFIMRDSETNAILVDVSFLFEEFVVFSSEQRIKIEKEEVNLIEFVIK